MSEADGRKHFVLDTNVLLHNPAALFMFKDHEVIIPFDVIEELDYRLEADNQRLFADYYDGHPFIHVPRVVDALSADRVLTTELATGVRLKELDEWSQEERNLAGETIFRQGDHGDRFYIVDSGEVEIEIDGREANVLGPGEHFGEIALLRDIPRTATARARKETQLYALDRDAFLGAVTGHAGSTEAAETVVVARLGLTG